MTPEIAMRLSVALGDSAEKWLGHQATYDLWEIKKRKDDLGAMPLVSLENADIETVSLSTDPQFMALIERSRSRQTTESGGSAEEMRKRLGQ